MQNRYIRKKAMLPSSEGINIFNFILSHVTEYLNITHHFHDNTISNFEFSDYGTN